MRNFQINNNTQQITFSDNRFYTSGEDEAVFVPSVTTILQAYPKDAHFYSWLKEVGDKADEIRDEAGRRGSVVHNMTERYDNGEELTLLSDDGKLDFKLSEWAMFERYVEFGQRNPYSVIHSEVNIINEKLGYAGTMDRVIKMGKKKVLIDIKTSNTIYEHYWLQLAAYHKLYTLEMMDSKAITDVAILWLNAKTRTYGNEKKGDIQGPGWQLVFRDKAQMKKDMALFDSVHKLWLHQNEGIKPRVSTYKLSHKK